MALRIEVPATVANLGSGYDALGLAVGLRNGFAFARGPWSVDGRPVDPDANLVLSTARDAARTFGGSLPGLALTTDERVPRSRGLGSSATARVAGLLAGLAATGADPDREARLGFLARAEGHPDNVWPALLGGLVVCGSTARTAPLHGDLVVAACVPDVRVDTPVARAALPAILRHADAVANVRAVATLLLGLQTGDPAALEEGVRDRLHQPWRGPLIGPVDASFRAAREQGGAPFVGGSGSTLCAFVVGDGRAQGVADALAEPFRARGIPCSTAVLRPDVRGATSTGTLDEQDPGGLP